MLDRFKTYIAKESLVTTIRNMQFLEYAYAYETATLTQYSVRSTLQLRVEC